MTREEFIKDTLKNYSLVKVLSTKNNGKVLHLRNKAVQKDIVLRSYPEKSVIYEKLYSISCENLPLIYDCIEAEDGQIVIEEYIDGMTVSDVMQSGKYAYSGIKRVVTAVCNALAVLHGFGIVHRDIKPENIVISSDGRIVLIDFNASRVVSSAPTDTVVLGTVGYASPEQMGIAQSDARTDIYALGVLLNVMATGQHPSKELAKGKLGKIVQKCTNVNPEQRYQSAQKLAEAL